MNARSFLAFFSVLSAASMTSAIGVSCSSSGNVGVGGDCYTATDCAPGLYCFGVTMTQAGMCTNNANKAAPPNMDGAIPDGGTTGSDAPINMGDTGAPPPPKDSGSGGMDTGKAPMDTGTPPMDTGTTAMDTGGATG